MTLPLGATWEQHLEWCEREIRLSQSRLDCTPFAFPALRMPHIARLQRLRAEAARCREEIIKAKGRER